MFNGDAVEEVKNKETLKLLKLLCKVVSKQSYEVCGVHVTLWNSASSRGWDESLTGILILKTTLRIAYTHALIPR